MPSGDALCAGEAPAGEERDITILPNKNVIPRLSLRMVIEASATE
jgi:hypothetical protein